MKQMTIISLTFAALVALGEVASAQETMADVQREFRGGFPTAEASAKCRDEADYQSAVTAYRFWYPTVSIEGVMQGNRSGGAKDAEAFTYVVAGPRQMAFTTNSDTPYSSGTIDLGRTGPVVVELPPGPYVGVINDHNQAWIMDIGLPGPDAGRGGKHLIIPPGYDGPQPTGYHVGRSSICQVYVAVRAIPRSADPKAALDSLTRMKVYPLSAAADPPPFQFIGGTDAPLDATCLAWEDNLKFWGVLHAVINDEPLRAEYAPMYGLLKALGVEKGKSFAPDARMKGILEQAARDGRTQMLVSAFGSDRPDRLVWNDRRWEWVALASEDGRFATTSGPDLEAADRWYIQAILDSPAMFRRKVGQGSLYWLTARDKAGAFLDGGKAYKLTVPQPVPASLFWSVTVYDALTRCQVQTDQNKAALRSLYEKFQPNADGSIDLYFGPKAPDGKEAQWIKTIAGKGWFAYFRIYGPEGPAFDGLWKPSDMIEMK